MSTRYRISTVHPSLDLCPDVLPDIASAQVRLADLCTEYRALGWFTGINDADQAWVEAPPQEFYRAEPIILEIVEDAPAGPLPPFVF